MKKEEIGYRTEGDKEYTRQIDGAQTKADLVKIPIEWSWLYPDAFAAVSSEEFVWSEWKNWRANKKYTTDPSEKGLRIYAVISLPANLIKIALVAHRFKTPWGGAFLALKKHGKLIIGPC